MKMFLIVLLMCAITTGKCWIPERILIKGLTEVMFPNEWDDLNFADYWALNAKLWDLTLLQDLSNRAVISYYECQYEANMIREALTLHISLANIPQQSVSRENISFLLFTRKSGAPQKLTISDGESSIKSSSLEVNKPIVLFADGYSSPSSRAVSNISRGILLRDDVNLIIVDWYSYNKFHLQYTRNITIPLVGRIVAEFVQQLMIAGVHPKQMYFIGFSAGAQIVGLAAKYISPKVGRLLAFDPQGSCFNFLPPTERLDKSHAEYVIVVHSSVGMRALPLNHYGDVTFYINGGFVQPHCLNEPTIDSITTCSHSFCMDLFLDSLLRFNSTKGLRCASYHHYLKGQCDCSDTVNFGYEFNSNSRPTGLYFIETTNSPYQSSRNNASCSAHQFHAVSGTDEKEDSIALEFVYSLFNSLKPLGN